MRLSSDPGATEMFSQRLDNLNLKYESLVQLLSQRLRTAIEVSGADGLVSTTDDCISGIHNKLSKCYNHQNYAESFQRPLRTYRIGFHMGGPSTDEPDDTFISYSNTE